MKKPRRVLLMAEDALQPTAGLFFKQINLRKSGNQATEIYLCTYLIVLILLSLFADANHNVRMLFLTSTLFIQ